MSNMIEMTLEQAEQAVEKLHNSIDMEWDGWDLVLYTPANSAMYHKSGAFRNGKWVMKNRIAVNGEGKYVVSGHNARILAKIGH